MSIQSGSTYKIVNTKTPSSVIDLSGGDNKTIIGYGYHAGKNQQWTFQDTGSGWTIKAASSGLYLGVEVTPANNAPLVAVSSPFKWDIWHDNVDNSSYRFFIHGTKFCVDLSGHGNAAPGTPVILWTAWAGTNQTWKIQSI